MTKTLRLGFAVTGFAWWALFGRTATQLDEAMDDVWEPFLTMDA